MNQSDPGNPSRNDWRRLICRYYDACSAGDAAGIAATTSEDVVHYFLAPNTGSQAVRGGEHLGRYWRKVQRGIDARWIVDHLLIDGNEAVIEWTMFWTRPETSERVATRGSEWFVIRDGAIAEIRSYYQLRDGTSELDGFDYNARGYSHVGAERAAAHPVSFRGPQARWVETT